MRQRFANNTDRIIFEAEPPTNSDKVYVTATEEWYGGGSDKIKLFDTREKAENYVESINKNGKLDIVVLEKVME